LAEIQHLLRVDRDSGVFEFTSWLLREQLLLASWSSQLSFQLALLEELSLLEQQPLGLLSLQVLLS